MSVSVHYLGLAVNKVLHSRNLVLVDSGANEVMRPYSASWWSEIESGHKGEILTASLAGGLQMECAMTQHGEIMMKTGRTGDPYGKWILPVCRMIVELGAKQEWTNKRG